MRTRIFNKMTTPEVEEYFARGGDTIFVAIGVVECHGFMPIDVETIGPEANAVLLAEKADGLAMINLPYFYPGATVTSRATVRLSIVECIEYLDKICYSLVDQGFKRIFLCSGHGPSGLYIDAFCRDFFEKTLIHPVHLRNLSGKPRVMDFSKPVDPNEFKKMSYASYGAYKIMNQMEYLPVDPNAEVVNAPRGTIDPIMDKCAKLCSAFDGHISQIYSDPNQHSGGIIFKSEEERLEACTIGEQVLREQVADSPICELKEALAEYQAYAQRIYAAYPHIKKTH